MFLFPTGILTPEKDGLYAQPHEDVMEYYRNMLLVTSFVHPSPFGRAVAGLAGSIFGAVLFVDDILDGSHVNNARRVYDFALDITTDGPPSEDDVIDDSTFDVPVGDFDSMNQLQTSGTNRVSYANFRCEHRDSKGRRCILQDGHSGRHLDDHQI